jgi:hypothetical protein
VTTFIREWMVPGIATALVAWIVIPSQPVEPEGYTRLAVAQHRACALERAVKPRSDGWYPPDEFTPLIPDLGGKIRVIEAHECAVGMKFTHVIVETDGGHKASILVTRSGEASERTFRPERHGDFEVSQVRTTRRRAFVVFDRQRARELREWREMTIARLHQFLKQLEGT